MQRSDRPISHPRDDVLGRAEFAQVLARSIDQLAAAQDGFVVGLIGDWGSGKSSVIELTLRYLRHREILDCSHDLKFEDGPVHELNIESIGFMADIYERIESKILLLEESGYNLVLWERTHRHKEFCRWLGSESDAELAYRYWKYKQISDLRVRNLVVKFSPWLIAGRAELASALISDVARAAGEKLGDEIRQAFASLIARLSQLASIVGAGTDVATGGSFGGLISAGAELSNKLASRMTEGPTLDEVRERLRAALANLKGQKLVVVIDDLDRLTPSEAVEMVSLVKNLGDLPNVVYILSYDENKLSNLINQSLQINGIEFLEKIVQYPVHLPPLEEDQILGLVNFDIIKILNNISSEDSRRLGQAWYYVIRLYLKTPRDVRRLMNLYSVAWSGLSDYADPIDLLLLEALRLHEPAVYAWIRRNLTIIVN
ncbi:KAP family P-loop NTPase fold protein [Bosea sp. (in: a-proteobacteria)]|uniref:KAP family P-loop NTPase fold protein n=1 Tax=Bosea sp. (in: a-proteobacteria) TaxID=1871050 RepID=UPI004033A8F8